MAFEKEKLTFLAVITLGVVVIYILSLVYGMATEKLPIKDFVNQLGPMAGTLLGYWIRDNQTSSS